MEYQQDYEDYEYEIEPQPARRRNRLLWIAGGIAAAALVACVCIVCITAAALIYLNSDGGGSPVAPTPPATSIDQIQNINWWWAELSETATDTQSDVPNPENYVVVFQPNGQLQIRADCNTASGVYAASGSQLSLEAGAMTLAECGPNSLSNQFLALLANVESFGMEGDWLALHVRDQYGRLLLHNAGPANVAPPPTPTPAGQPPAPMMGFPPEAEVGQQVTFDGSQSQPGSSPIAAYRWEFGDGGVAEAATATYAYGQAGTYEVRLTVTGQDGLQSTAAGQLVIKEAAAPGPEPTQDPGAGLIGPTWRWTELNQDGQTLVPNPESYTLQFQEGGALSVVADCNNGSGSYVAEGDTLRLDLGAISQADCGPDSLSSQFLGALGSVERFELGEGRLVLHLAGGAGNMVFAP